ncbi:MAG TPA: site-specific integrase [Gemmatirosa sp.]
MSPREPGRASAPGVEIVVRPDAALALPFRPEELAAAYDYAGRAQAPATVRAYTSDVAVFSAWCAARSHASCPAAATTIAVFLADEAQRGIKPSTLARRVAAIRYAHVGAGLEPPTDAPEVRQVMRGIRRTVTTRPTRKAPATAECVVAMLAHCPATLAGLRDRALLQLGFGGAFRRSELSALDVADLEEKADGLLVTVRRSKTDQEGAGAVVAVARGVRDCPVAAVRAWLTAAAITTGPAFRPVSKEGRPRVARFSAYSVGELVKAYAARAGYDPATFGGHSLRAGFLTSAAERGKPLDRMMAVSRHKRVDTVLGYIRRADDFKDHAGAGLL